ncbi:asparagine synthase-related protein [Kordiimonas sp.]|uniref:asparagine synthase-related protein n=1 Tax=Kordiimonas sp. TaxID=1970157 RepID=UPI003B527D80
MYRYIAFLWNEADDSATRTAGFLRDHFMGTATKWETAYSGSGLQVLHAGEEKGRMQAYPVSPKQGAEAGGVILGKLFDRPDASDALPGNVDLSVGEARRVIETAGCYLVDNYWGAWVAFLQHGYKKHVLADPIGTFSCFHTHYRGVEIYFNHVPDVAACKFLAFTIDWCGVARYLRYATGGARTGLKEVDKLLSGQCLTITPWATENVFYWDPQKISQTNVIEDVAEAEATLHKVLMTTVAAHAAPYDRILHEIGGLDSSILLACLKEARASLDITCITNFDRTNPMGDERHYVRQVTEKLSVPLIEHDKKIVKLDADALQRLPLTTKPIYYGRQIEFESNIPELARENGLQARFNGWGGDEILYARESSYGAIDYLKTHGLRRPLLRLIMEAARLQNLSVWSILPKIFRDGLGRKQWDFYTEFDPGTTTLLNDDIQDLIKPDGSVHPWIKQGKGMVPGKLDHIFHYTRGFYNEEYNTWPGEHVPMIYPLLAQPVIETCLRIPSWVMTANGKSRGLARKAFRHHLPADVVWRTSKLSSGAYQKAFIDENIGFIRECLLDGVLVSDKVVNKTNLKKTLARDHNIGNQDGDWLMYYINAEIWARKWRGKAFPDIARGAVA